MIEIIKHGKKRIFKKICSYCECEFTYELSDITYSYHGGYGIFSSKFICCPECNNLLPHGDDKEEYININDNHYIYTGIKYTNKDESYDDYNFQSIKKFVACKWCQYYKNEKCTNKDDCFWLGSEKKFKALDIIKTKKVNVNCIISGWSLGKYNSYKTHISLTQDEFDLLKKVLL